MALPGMRAVDHKTGRDVELESKTLISVTAGNDLESTKHAFLTLMEIYTRTPHFEQMFRELISSVQLTVDHSVNTSCP
jgi:hypothetical protein